MPRPFNVVSRWPWIIFHFFLLVLHSPLSNLCSERWAQIAFNAWRRFFFTRQIIRQMLIKIRLDLPENYRVFPPEEDQGNETKGEQPPKNWNKTSRVLVEIAPKYLCFISTYMSGSLYLISLN